ncbi:recombinase family protein [Tropicimonas sp. S265A]|uniref:recombinase family protein n=1 Tax=Tropicimonas sp. S265A TaxID=3415134 RepID=UPI003C7D6EDA
MTDLAKIKGPFVLYFRVSTRQQKQSGLGLDAQRRDIDLFLDNYADGEVIGEFQDTESGKYDDPQRRPGLSEALEMCRKTGATLLVSKLDRLSRKVAHIAALMDDKHVTFKVASMPFADRFQLHIHASLAEQEREFISLRTKAALQAARTRGQALGGLRDKTNKRNQAARTIADIKAHRIADIAVPLREAGKSYQAIADALNAANVQTPGGGRAWYASGVRNALMRLE